MKEIKQFNPYIQKLSINSQYIANTFNSQELPFDDFIQNIALKESKEGEGVTYLVINKKEKSNDEIVAYYTLKASTVYFKDRYDFEDNEIKEDEKREHFSPISAFMIRMFSVNKQYQDTKFNGNLIAKMVLEAIIHELNNMSINIIGAKAIILCSVPSAVKFYERTGFKKFKKQMSLLDDVELEDNIPMYMNLHESILTKNEKIKKEAVKAIFSKINGHEHNLKGKKVFIEGKVKGIINDGGLNKFSLKLKENNEYVSYEIASTDTEFDNNIGENIKENDLVKVYGIVNGKRYNSMPNIDATIIEKVK